VVIASAIANAIAAQAAVSRILFAMARDGKLPAVFAKIHPRFKTPYVSTLVVAVVSLVAAVLMRMDDLSRIVNFGALTSFLLLHLSVVNHFFIRGRSGRWLQHLVFPILGAAVIGFVLYEMDMWAKIVGACWVGVGVVYYLVLTLVMKKPVELEI
jgi:amino acid transporter